MKRGTDYLSKPHLPAPKKPRVVKEPYRNEAKSDIITKSDDRRKKRNPKPFKSTTDTAIGRRRRVSQGREAVKKLAQKLKVKPAAATTKPEKTVKRSVVDAPKKIRKTASKSSKTIDNWSFDTNTTKIFQLPMKCVKGTKRGGFNFIQRTINTKTGRDSYKCVIGDHVVKANKRAQLNALGVTSPRNVTWLKKKGYDTSQLRAILVSQYRIPATIVNRIKKEDQLRKMIASADCKIFGEKACKKVLTPKKGVSIDGKKKVATKRETENSKPANKGKPAPVKKATARKKKTGDTDVKKTKTVRRKIATRKKSVSPTGRKKRDTSPGSPPGKKRMSKKA